MYEHRCLGQQRQTRGHRVDLVLLVELHHLFVELGAVVAILVLQLAHLRRQLLHLEHALGALERERCGDGHHHGGDHRDRDGVAVRQTVEPRQQGGRNLEHRLSRPLGHRGTARPGDRRLGCRRERSASVRGPGRIRSARTVDIAPDGRTSATRLVRCRAARTPRGRSGNTWGRTDTARVGRRTHAGTPRSTRGPDAATRSSSGDLLASHLVHQRRHRCLEFYERLFARGNPSADEVQPRRDVALGQNRTEAPTEAISRHGGTDGATDGERHLRGNQVGIEDERTPQRIGPDPDSIAPEADEGVAFADPVDQAESRARPLARRDFSTARPARVLIRARKPCLRARRRLLG
jgi:hypothetical protein